MTRINELRQRLAEIDKPNVEGSVYHESFDIRSKQKGLSQKDKIDDYKELGHSPAYNEMFESEMGDIPTSMVEGSGNPKGSSWASELSTKLRMKGRTKKQQKKHPSGTTMPYSVIDMEKDHAQGHPTLSETLSPENVKTFEKWGNEYDILGADDPNIAAISRENAKRYSKLKIRLAVVGAIKKYNKEKHKQEIRDDTIAELGIWAEPPVSAELGLERYKKRGRSKLKHRKEWMWKDKQGNRYRDKGHVFQKGEANMRDVDNPMIQEPKRWNKKERDIIKTPTYKGDRVSNIRGPSNKYGLKQREMKNLKQHLDSGGLTQKRYDQQTTRPRYPKERIVEQMGLFGPIKDNLWRDDPTGADMIANFDEIFKATGPHDNIADVVGGNSKDIGDLDNKKKYAKLKQRLARIYES